MGSAESVPTQMSTTPLPFPVLRCFRACQLDCITLVLSATLPKQSCAGVLIKTGKSVMELLVIHAISLRLYSSVLPLLLQLEINTVVPFAAQVLMLRAGAATHSGSWATAVECLSAELPLKMASLMLCPFLAAEVLLVQS